MTLGLPRPPPIVEIEEGAKQAFVLLTPVRLRVGAAHRIPAPPLQEAVPLVGLQDRDVESPTPARPHIPRCVSPVSGFTRRGGVGGACETCETCITPRTQETRHDRCVPPLAR